jgi:hypothetical protein
MAKKILSVVVIVVGAVITQSTALHAAAAASAPAIGRSIGPSIGPSGARPGHPNNRRSNSARNQDNRATIVESNLRSINRSLDANRPGSPAIPAPSHAERAPIPPTDSQASDRALRSSLHKLKRETAIEQSGDKRRAQIEAAQP